MKNEYTPSQLKADRLAASNRVVKSHPNTDYELQKAVRDAMLKFELKEIPKIQAVLSCETGVFAHVVDNVVYIAIGHILSDSDNETITSALKQLAGK